VIGACGGLGGIVGLAGAIHDSRICFNLALHDDLDWELKIMRSRSTCVKNVAERRFYGVSENIVTWHIRKVSALYFPKSVFV
jgi:hypothetical protein